MKQHTIIFVPHARARFRKWRVTTLQVALVLGTLLFLTVGGGIATWLYFDTSFDREELTKIEQENAELRAVNQRFESNIRQLEGRLGGYQERIQQLAIVAGLAELASTSEPGIGGLDTSFASLELGGPTADSDLDAGIAALEEQADELDAAVDVVADRLEDRRIRMSRMPTVTPAKGILTSGFGYRKDPFTGRRAFHQGIDIVAPYGNEIRAPGDGIVTKAGRVTGYGNAVYLSHGYGITSRFGHMSKLAVEPGESVKRGDVIGYLGSSGRATGNHLHYEVRVDGRPENPLGYILDETR